MLIYGKNPNSEERYEMKSKTSDTHIVAQTITLNIFFLYHLRNFYPYLKYHKRLCHAFVYLYLEIFYIRISRSTPVFFMLHDFSLNW